MMNSPRPDSAVVEVARVTGSAGEGSQHCRMRPRDKCCKRLDEVWNTGGHFERLHLFACTGHDPNWFEQFVMYESSASVIKAYHGKCVPALAQTADYAQAIVLAAGRRSEVESATRARMTRQEILKRSEPPYLWLLLDQEVLENTVGGREVMAGQLRYLLELADTERVCVRIVPRTVGWHPGHDGHFQVLTISGRDVAYAVAQVAGRLIEAGDESGVLDLRFDEIGAVALSRADSKVLIKQTMRTYQ